MPANEDAVPGRSQLLALPPRQTRTGGRSQARPSDGPPRPGAIRVSCPGAIRVSCPGTIRVSCHGAIRVSYPWRRARRAAEASRAGCWTNIDQLTNQRAGRRGRTAEPGVAAEPQVRWRRQGWRRQASAQARRAATKMLQHAESL